MCVARFQRRREPQPVARPSRAACAGQGQRSKRPAAKATAIVPKIYDATLADRRLGISTEAAYEMVRRVARDEGLLLGISSGAALVGCMTVAKKLAAENREAVIVTIFPDSGDKYLSERFWTE